MGGNGSGDNNFVVNIVVASLHSLINVAQKEERKNDRQRRTNKDKEKKKLQLGAFKKQERKVLVPFQYKDALLVI